MDSSVAALVDRLRTAWREHNPIAASVWGPPVLERSEDLSDRGLRAWGDVVASLSTEASICERSAGSAVDRAVSQEVRRFLREQDDRLRRQRLYQRQLTPYLQLQVLGLLPFALGPRLDPSMQPALLDRLRRYVDWLVVAEKRFREGALGVTRMDRTFAHGLSGIIVRLFGPGGTCASHETTSGAGRDLIEALLEQLSHWYTAPVRPSTIRPVELDLEEYLADVLGTSRSVGWWHEALTDRFGWEIERLAAAYARTERRQARPDPPDAAVLQPLEWMRVRYEALRRNARSGLLERLGPPAAIERAPDLLELLVRDGLYVRSASARPLDGSPGTLFVPPAALETSRSAPDFLRANLSMILAHELCPGHGEQLHRAYSSDLRPLYEVCMSPLGLEGWGMYAESAILRLDEPDNGAMAATVHFHRARRLGPSARRVSTHVLGRSAADALITERLDQLPAVCRDRLTNIVQTSGWPSLVYACGFVETEAALDDLGARLGEAPNDPRVTETYLAWGPISPGNVLRCVRDLEQGEGT